MCTLGRENFFFFYQQIFTRVSSKESGDNRQALLRRGEEAFLAVEIHTLI